MAIAHTSGLSRAASFLHPSQYTSGIAWSYPTQGTTADTFVSWITDDTHSQSGDSYMPYWGGAALTNPVPSNVTINGLIVRIKKYDSGSQYTGTSALAATDAVVRLIYNGGFVGDNKSTGSAWPDTSTYTSYGSNTDTWNVSGGLTPSVINSSGFGISISPYIKWTNITGLAGGNSFDQPTDDVRAFGEIPQVIENGLDGQVAIDSVEFTFFYDSATPLSILPSTVGTGQSTPVHRLRAIEFLYPNTIGTGQSVGTSRLYPKKSLFAITIGTGQSVANQRIVTKANILPSTVGTGQSVGTNNLKPFSFVYPATISTTQIVEAQRLRNNNNLFPATVGTGQSVPNDTLKAFAFVYPGTIGTGESVSNVSTIKSRVNINQLSITSLESIPSHLLYPRKNLFPVTVGTGESVARQSLRANNNLFPSTVATGQSVANQRLYARNNLFPITVGTGQSVALASLTATKNLIVNTIATTQTTGTNRLTNLFYDTLDQANTFTHGDVSFFNWENSFSLFANGYSLRRVGVSGVKTLAYAMPFDRGSNFYWQSYVQINTDPGVAGVGFGISTQYPSNGYFAVIDSRNSSASTSTNSFQLRRVTGGAAPATTVMSRFNQTGLIEKGKIYRITITWASNGGITARLYDAKGSTLVSTLTATDATYTTGYSGITAFSDSYFDHLTNIPAQFTTANTVTSQESVSDQTLLDAGNGNIFPVTIGTGQSVGISTLKARAYIFPSTISTAQSVATQSVVRNINPVTVGTGQSVPTIHFIKPTNNILPNTITTAESFGTISFKIYINPETIATGQSVPSNHRVQTLSSMYPSTIGTGQSTPTNHNLIKTASIYPITISSQQTFSTANISSVIIPGTIGTGQSVGVHTLKTFKSIFPSTISTTERLIGQSISLGTNITQTSASLINSTELITNHLLKAGNVDVRPSTITSQQTIIGHELRSLKFIYPVTVGTGQSVAQNHNLSNILPILPSTIGTGQSTPNNHLLYARKNIYPSTITTVQSLIGNILNLTMYPVTIGTGQSIPNNHILRSNYNLYPATVATGQSVPTNHLLYARKNIYPSTIDTLQSLIGHKLSTGIIILPTTVGTGQSVPQNHFLRSNYFVYPITVGTGQSTPTNHRLINAKNINPVTISTTETLINHSLRSNIYPVTVGTGQSVPLNHLLRNNNFIYPSTLTTAQDISNVHELIKLAVGIRPTTIGTGQSTPTNHLLKAFTKIYPFTVGTGESVSQNHKLSSIKFIQPTTVGTVQLTPTNHLLRSNYNLYPTSVSTGESTGIHLLKSRAFIYPNGLLTNELITGHELNNSLRMYPVTIGTGQSTPINHQLITVQYIDAISIGTGQSTPFNHRLVPGNVNIYPFEILSSELIFGHKVDNIYKIYPITVGTGQSLPLNHRLIPGTSRLIQLPLVSAEIVSELHKLSPIAFIYPRTILEASTVRPQGAYLQYGQWIYHNSDNDGQPSYSPWYPTELATIENSLISNAYIQPIEIASVEDHQPHQLTYKLEIRLDDGIASQEISENHRLRSIAYIYPSTITTLEAISTHKVNANTNIYPFTIDTEERASWNQVDVYLSALNNQTGNEIQLTKDNLTLFTWSTDVYPRVEVVINDNILASGYGINSNTGVLYLTTPITSSDTLVVRLYSTITPPLHDLYYESFIYPFTIDTVQKIPLHRLKYTSFPGLIHSWFEKRLTIESDLNFRSKS